MIFRVKASAVATPVDQRAEFIDTQEGKLRVLLLGPNKIVTIDPEDTCGVEFSTTVEIFYKAYGAQKT